MKTLFLILTILTLPLTQAHAHSAGIVLGNPTGLNGQYVIDSKQLMDLVVGSQVSKGDLETSLIYYRKRPDAYNLSTLDMDLLFGGGVKIKEGVGLTGNISTSHPIQGESLEVFGVLGVAAYFIAEEGSEVDAYVGVRYLF